MHLLCIVATALLFRAVNTLSPGAQIQISQAGIDKAVESLLQQVLVKFSSFEVDETIRVWILKIFNIHVTINVNPKNAQIQLLDTGDILVRIRDLKIEVTGRLRYNVELWRKTFDLLVKTKNTFLEITFGIVSENEKPRILNKRVDFDTGKPDIYVDGGPLSLIIEKTMDLFRGKLRKWFNQNIISVLNNKINEFSNRIVQIETEKALGGHLRGLFIDYGLGANPSVANSALTIPVAAQFWARDHKDEALVKPSGPYPFSTPWQMACVDMDTNVIYGTLAYAYNLEKGPGINKTFSVQLTQEFKDNFLDNAVGCSCSSFICPAKWIPAISEICSKGTEMIVKMSNMDRDLHINNTGVYLLLFGIGSVDIVLDNVTERVLDLKMEIFVHLEEHVTIKNWTVRGNIHVHKRKLTASSPLFLIGTISEIILNNLWDSKLQVEIQKWADNLEGAGIPLPQLKFASFCNSRIGFHESFVRLCSDIDFKFEKILPSSLEIPPPPSYSGVCPTPVIPFDCRTCIASFAPLLRSNKESIQDHFYTTDSHEQQHAVEKHKYSVEGQMGFLGNTLISQCSGVRPIYRMWSDSENDHFYTTSHEEMQMAMKDYKFESIIGHCMETLGPGLIPLYRFYSPGRHDHFYTIDENEKNVVQMMGDYRFEGIQCYVWMSNSCPPEHNKNPKLLAFSSSPTVLVGTASKALITPLPKQEKFNVPASSTRYVPTFFFAVSIQIISIFV